MLKVIIAIGRTLIAMCCVFIGLHALGVGLDYVKAQTALTQVRTARQLVALQRELGPPAAPVPRKSKGWAL